MGVFFQDTYLVDSRDIDLFGHCRPSAVLGSLQEAAIQAASALHVSREEMVDQYNAFWMLSRIRFELYRPLKCGEYLTVKTWHRGGKSALMYREFELMVEEVPVGKAVSIWILADMDTHKLLHLSGIRQFEGTDGGELCRGDILRKPHFPDELAFAERRRMHYSDTDINGHVNNGKYADLVCDALSLETIGKGHFVSGLQIGYLAECMSGEEVSLFTGQEGKDHLVLGKGPEGKDRFQAILTLDKLAEED